MRAHSRWWSSAGLIGVAAAANAQQFSVEQHRLTPPELAGSNYDLAVGDIDGDGDLDLAWTGYVTGIGLCIRLAHNDGQGRFSVAVPSLQVAGGPYNFTPGLLEFADIDGDGDLDLLKSVTPPGFGGPAALFRNDGPAGFTDVSSQWIASPEAPVRMLVVDWDGDGDRDIVTCNRSIPNHHTPPSALIPSRIYRNDGTGVFTEMTGPWFGANPHADVAVDVGDVDGDGDNDAVFAVTYSGPTSPSYVRVKLQDAQHVGVDAPGLVPPMPVPTAALRDLALLDLDLDGDLDLAVASDAGGYLFANNGTGSFSFVALLPGADLHRWVPGDFDGDGRIDLLALRPVGLSAILYANTPAGFVDVTAARFEGASLGPGLAVAGDFDGDGDLDLLGATQPRPVIWHNDGQGRLLDALRHRLTNDEIELTRVGDVDGDGDLDLAYTRTARAGVWFAANNGDGPGPKVLALHTGQFTASALEWIDVDQDGDLDLFVGGYPDRVLEWTGGQYVDATATRWPFATSSAFALVADVDGDGASDVITGSIFDARLHRGDGAGGFVDATASLGGASPALSAACFDFDADGDLDLALAGAVRILRNEWPNPFVDVTATLGLSISGAYAVATLDVDRDGRRDLLVGGWHNGTGLTMLRSVGTGLVDETSTRVSVVVSPTASLAVVDLDGDGWEDVCVQPRAGSQTTYLRNDNGVLVPFTFPAGTAPRVPAAADFDGDGDVDRIASHGLLRNVARQLQNAAPPRLGCAAELVVHAHGGNGIDPQAALLFLSPQLAPVPVATPFGALYLDPALAIYHSTHLIAGTGGEVTIPYTVPSSPSVLGTVLHAQAAFVHEPDPATWRLGNLVSLEVRL